MERDVARCSQLLPGWSQDNAWEDSAWCLKCAVGCGVLRVVVRLPDGVRRPRAARPTGSSAAQGASMPMRAACEAAVRLARKVSVRRGTRVCVHAAGAGGRGRRRGLTAVRCRLVFGVARAGAWEALPPSRCARGKKKG